MNKAELDKLMRLRAMVEDEIKRDGLAGSFTIRSGLLLEMIDALALPTTEISHDD